MDLTKLTSSDIKQITKLLQRKETLQAEIAEIDRALASFEAGTRPAGRRRRKTTRRPASKKSTNRVPLKELIVAELKNAGAQGIKVRDLAAKLGTKPANVHAWFFSTGKKYPEIKKLEGGTYRWEG